jgi:putative transposase
LHQAVRDRRRNWIEIQTTRLVRDHDLVAVENLNVKGMVRRPKPKPDPEQPGAFLPNGAASKSGLNRSIHEQGWSIWLSRLRDKAHASGVEVADVNPRHTSQQCRACSHIAAANRESQAVFCCESCGHEAHADRNAAENILARALVTRKMGLALAPTRGPGASKPKRPAARVRRPPRRSENQPRGLANAA